MGEAPISENEPGGLREAMVPRAADIDPDGARCRRCGASLTAHDSVRRLLGPICAHHEQVVSS